MDKLIGLFGRRLRTLRKSKGLTLEQLGHASGVGYKHIAEIERGAKVPSFEAISRLAGALKAEPYELFLPERLSGKPVDRSLRILLGEIERYDRPAVKRFLLDVLTSVRSLFDE